MWKFSMKYGSELNNAFSLISINLYSYDVECPGTRTFTMNSCKYKN